MTEGMCRAICAVYVERWHDRLCYRKRNGITQYYYDGHSNLSGGNHTTATLIQSWNYLW